MRDLPELEGFWWVPSDPEQQLAGRITSDNDAAKLILTIDRPNPSGGIFSNRDHRDYEVLHGRTTDGKLVTLLKCFDLNSSWSSSGIEKRIILANYLLVGGLVPEEMLEQAFSKLSLKWPALQRWFFHSGVEVEHDRGNLRSFKVTYKPQEQIRFSYSEDSEINFVFGTDKLPMGGPLAEGINFKEVVWVEVQKNEPAGLSYYLERLNELVHFFSICVLEYNHPEKVSLIGAFSIEKLDDGKEMPPLLEVYFSSVQEPESNRLPHPIEVLLPYGSIKDDFSGLLSNWAKAAESLSPARSLYFSSLYGQTRYVESTFLSLAQAAEVLHRRRYGGTYIDTVDYENRVKPNLIDAIPHELPSDVKTAFSQRLSFFNEISLAKRLKELCRNNKDVLDSFVSDWKGKIRKVVSARNYYTHYSEAQGTSKPDINELVEAREFLRMILELEMLIAAGINIEILHDRAKQCQRYRWRFPIDRGQ